VVLVITLFGALVLRSFMIARRAEMNGSPFSAFLAYGIGIWLGLQAFINIGVNMGVLPTKGLTLPFMSYGGSSLIVCCAAVGLLLRIYYECNSSQAVTRKRSTTKPGKRSERRPATLRETFEEAA